MRTGIDLGGTKIEIIAMDEDDCVIYQQRASTPQGDYEATLETIAQLVFTLEEKIESSTTIGMGTPGAISQKTGRLKNSNSTCLNNRQLKQDLENLLERKIRTSNDANCFALSEATDGAASGASSMFGVIIGTGTGAGIVIDHKILEGANRIAGEWGHNPLPWPGKDEQLTQCYCGLHGCIETFLSGPGMAADFSRQTKRAMTANQIAAAAEQGDNAAEKCLQRYEQRLARALSHIINIIDPEIIVLGGGLSNIQRLYKNVPNYWGEFIFSDMILTKLVPPMHGDSSGVRGAARLWSLDEAIANRQL